MTSRFKALIESHNSFKGQEHGETVILVVRRHPFPIIVNTLFFGLMSLVPFVLGTVFSSFIYSNGLSTVFLFLTSLWCLILWSGVFYALTMYILDVWIVTDRRIIDSTQRGFFNRVVSELHTSRIQDMSVTTQGIIATFLKFGDLHVQTAGNDEKFLFVQIPHPEKVKDEIMKIVSARPHP